MPTAKFMKLLIGLQARNFSKTVPLNVNFNAVTNKKSNFLPQLQSFKAAECYPIDLILIPDAYKIVNTVFSRQCRF